MGPLCAGMPIEKALVREVRAAREAREERKERKEREGGRQRPMDGTQWR